MEEEGRRKVKVRERNAMMEAEVVVIKCEKEPTLLIILKMEESHEAKKCQQPDKARKQILPYNLQKETQACLPTPSFLPSKTHIRLLVYKIITNLCCLKLQNCDNLLSFHGKLIIRNF